ncbi:WD40/YVTN repeat-like-containing domain [Phaffia rhodozyma]|uniref:WD40/YVTN repeat-like-containing domain n=1 Tax=Phaffia rhodozyma TaxID=264483 RepID=A0A0F7SGP2_PHARH|nr:WD40/YVTN repeat-like-containing domain [Phaffia rhodozyma]
MSSRTLRARPANRTSYSILNDPLAIHLSSSSSSSSSTRSSLSASSSRSSARSESRSRSASGSRSGSSSTSSEIHVQQPSFSASTPNAEIIWSTAENAEAESSKSKSRSKPRSKTRKSSKRLRKEDTKQNASSGLKKRRSRTFEDPASDSESEGFAPSDEEDEEEEEENGDEQMDNDDRSSDMEGRYDASGQDTPGARGRGTTRRKGGRGGSVGSTRSLSFSISSNKQRSSASTATITSASKTHTTRPNSALSRAPSKPTRRTISLPTHTSKAQARRKETKLPPTSKNTTHEATMSDAMPPLFPHYTSYLAAPPGLNRRSEIVRKVGGRRITTDSHGNEREEFIRGKESEEEEEGRKRPMGPGETARRVRIFTRAAWGMTPWEGWAGEGWRPNSARGDKDKNGWEGVERHWRGIELLDERQGAKFLPKPTNASSQKLYAGILTDDKAQEEYSIPVYGATSLEDIGVEKKGCIFNPGGPVWDLDWCPMTEEESEKRGFKLYLAVSVHQSLDDSLPIGQAKPSNTPGSIQIWSISPPSRPSHSSEAVSVDPSAMDVSSESTPTATGVDEAAEPSVEVDLATQASTKGGAEEEEEKTEEPSPPRDGFVKSEDEEEEECYTLRSVNSDEERESSVRTKRSALKSAAWAPLTPGYTPKRIRDIIFNKTPASKEDKEEVLIDLEGWEMEMKLEMVVCIDGGNAWKVQWCPSDSADKLSTRNGSNSTADTIPKLGVLAATFEDGSAKVLSIPDPDAVRGQADVISENKEKPLYVKLKPSTVLDIDDGMCWCLDWGSDRMLAVGTTHGKILVWDVKEAALTEDDLPIPLHSIQAHSAPIRSLSYLRAPQADAQGIYQYDWEQSQILSVSMNGRIVLTDLRESGGSAGGGGSSLTLRMVRDMTLATTAVSIQNGSGLIGDGDFAVQMIRGRPRNTSTFRKVSAQEGAIWALSTSDYHPNIASASADGSLVVSNTLRGTTHKKVDWVSLMEVIYRMDMNEATGEMRMLDNILPQNVSFTRTHDSKASVLPSLSVSSKPSSITNTVRPITSAWRPEIAVLSTSWNSGSGVGRSPLLASGMACGLARVDVMIEGRWNRARFRRAADIAALRECVDGET